MNGIDIPYLQKDTFNTYSSKPNDFCTRERFIQYFTEVVRTKERYSSEEIDSIMNELDPYYTGIIQI